MNFSETLIYIFLSLGLSTKVYAQTPNYSYVKKDLHAYLDVIQVKKGFSGEILVAKEKEIIFQESTGFASREHNLEIKNGAKYRIASISKTFTGVLIALAQQENQLNVYDKVIQYIEGLSPKFEEVSIHQLLRHTSGLPHNEGIKDYWQTKSSNENYGYGWFVREGTPIKYYHGGGTWGFSSYLAFFPEDNISIVILSNVSSLPTESIAEDLEKIVYQQKFKMLIVDEEIRNDSINLEKYSGDFISDSGRMKLKISHNKERLFAKLGGNPVFEIYPKGNHRFFGKKIEIAFTFELKEEKVEGLSAERMGQTFHFRKALK